MPPGGEPSSPRPPPRTVLWVLAALCAALAGCGGGGDDGAPEREREAARSPAAGAAPPEGAPAPAPAAPRPLPAAARPLLRDDLRSTAEDAGATAGVGLVSVGGRTAWSEAVGAARGADAVFPVASITKPFVAVLALRLADQGRLRLDDEVGRWLGDDVHESLRPATIRQLLGHTSDIKDRLTPRLEAALRDPGHRWTERELLEPMRRADDPQGAHVYANANYLLLGAILRRASRLGTDALLGREITAPLGLRRTSFRRRPELADAIPGGRRLPSYAWGELFTDGGMVSTAPELARFLHALVVERRLLRPLTLREMLAPGPDGRYGLGVTEVSTMSDCFIYGHIGTLPGWSSSAAVDARSGVAIVVLLRGATGDDVADGSLLLLNTLRNQGVLTCG